MNIQVQCCGLAILTLLLFFSLRKKSLGIFSEKLFRAMLMESYLCIVLDIVSVATITYHENLPDFIVLFICKLYITSLLWVGFLGFIYAIVDLHDLNYYFRIIRKDCILVVVGTLLIFICPIYPFFNHYSK